MRRLLVCAPEHYRIAYEINPWMRMSNKADPDRAYRQWQGLMKALQETGAVLESVPSVAGLPDMVFTANAGVVAGRCAVPSRFRHAERQKEERFFESWFRERGFEVVMLEEGLYFEGAGDLLGFSDAWFGGYRQRSEIRAYPRLSEIFGREIIPLELVDSRFYHLDTCFCPLSGGHLLYYPPAFDRYAQAVIHDRIAETRRIVVPHAEALRFACNAVSLDKHVVLPDGCDETMRLLKRHGYEPYPIELDEFMKAGGSAKCLTLALD